MKARKIFSKLLLAFVLVSVGVAIGKEMAAGRGQVADPTARAPSDQPSRQKVVVYYLHTSFRCPDCTAVETMADELLHSEFADELAAGAIEWKPVDYLENEQLAERYKVGGNMIVVARFAGDREVQATRLDKVMDLARDREGFLAYVRQAVAAAVKEMP